MKRCFTLLAVMLFTVASWAQNTDYLLKKDFQSEKKKISDGIDAARKSGIDAKKLAAKQVVIIDSLEKKLSANNEMLLQTKDSLQKTASRFTDLEGRVNKSSNNAQNSILVAVIVFALLFLFVFALIFFLKRNSNEKIRELSAENSQLGESVKEEIARMKEELKTKAEALALSLHSNSANLAARLELAEEKQQSINLEIKESVEKMAREQTAQKTKIEEQMKEFMSKATAEKTEHKSLHDKIETEVKGLRSLHIKDVEELKSKL